MAGDKRDMDIEKKRKKLIDTKLQDMKIEKMRQNARVTQENAVYWCIHPGVSVLQKSVSIDV